MQVLVADKLDESALEELRKAGLEVIVKTGLAGDELKKALSSTDVLAVRSQPKVTADVLAAAKNLKLIVRAGIGLDNIDCIAAEKAGIMVRNTPSATTASVAEHAFALMLALVRYIPQAHAKLSQGIWEKSAFMGTELFGKTLGIVGFGRIGRELAKRAHAFGMKVIAHDPFLQTEQVQDLGIPLLALENLLQQADLVSLHLPYTEATHHFLNKERLSQMKKGALLINCARGGIVDEEAAAEYLKNGHLRGAAFDVFAVEPFEHSPLMGLGNVILTPHLGASTKEGQQRAGLELAKIIIEFAQQKKSKV